MELAKKCTGKGQKCCSVSDNEDTSKKIFENKNVKHSHKVTQNYIKQTKQEVTNIYLLLPVLGLKKFLYKSATHRKRWSLRHHISLWWWLKKIEKKKHKYSTSFISCTWTPDASVHITACRSHALIPSHRQLHFSSLLEDWPALLPRKFQSSSWCFITVCFMVYLTFSCP